MNLSLPSSLPEPVETPVVREDPNTDVTEDEKTPAAGGEETPVEETPATGEEEKEVVDPVQALLEGEDRSVPERVFIKQKKQNKKLLKEIEQLKQRFGAETPKELKEPNPQDYDDGTSDPKYIRDLSDHIKSSVKSELSKTLQLERSEQKKAEYESLYDQRIADATPEAVKRVDAYKSANPVFKQTIESPEVTEFLRDVPREVSAIIMESENIGPILDYYTRSISRLDNLINLDIAELVNLGQKLGALKHLPKRAAKLDLPETPVSSGKGDIKKLHPIKDGRDAYLKAFKGNQAKADIAWKKDMDAMRKKGG
jgi:hypothetical protein